jgi:hypothetical protein
MECVDNPCVRSGPGSLDAVGLLSFIAGGLASYGSSRPRCRACRQCHRGLLVMKLVLFAPLHPRVNSSHPTRRSRGIVFVYAMRLKPLKRTPLVLSSDARVRGTGQLA